jgi:chromosome segregation ATPase
MLEKARADLAATSNVAKEIEKLKAQHAEEVTALKKQMLDSVESHVALSNAQIELEKARQELIDHQEANGPMAQLMLSMSADMDQLRTTIDDLTTENAALRSASHQSNSTVSADLKASEKTIENLSHENLELKKSVNAYKVILAMFEDSIGILEESTRRSDQKTAQAPVDVKDPSQVTTRLDNLQTAVASLQSELDHLHAELDNTKLNQGIAVRDFTAGSLMQFIKNEDGFYEATQDGSAIRHFLDQSCFDVFHASKQSKKPLYGFLVYVDHVISDEPVAENFNLPENTPFCKVTVEKTQFPLVQN